MELTEQEQEHREAVLAVAGGRADFAQARVFLDALADHADEWAGIPMSIEGERLHIHPKYKFAKVFNKTLPEETEPTPDEPKFNIVNGWTRNGQTHYIIRDVETKRVKLMSTAAHTALDYAMRTLGIVDAWEIMAEHKALTKLGELVGHRQLRSYLLTGQFIERSKRSGVWYVFRRLRPTIALSATSDRVKPLCGLCLHPIGYFEDTFGGSMVPTDDVVAHLCLMRGDEHGYWKQANQHPPETPNAGIC